MSLINFLNSKLKPSVECDSICLDGYSAANLIADDAEQLSRGFIAYSITKPPVEIVFDFPKAIDLKVIKLWNTTGGLRSTSFDIHGKYQGIWERVAHVRDLNKDVECVMFCYQSEYSSRSNSGKTSSQQCSENVFFFKMADKILSTSSSIKITIRATHKCAPVLRKAEVWGLPSKMLAKVDRELIKTIWNEIINPFDHQHIGQRSPSRNVPEQHSCSQLEIPEEFLDAITWELMIFPTVLPSGKVVDQSTIDKHSEMEAKWGRMPSDPFTGLEFTAHRKAILNTVLKSRIEKFLFENSEHFKTVPRSLGSSRVRRSKNRHASQFASLCLRHSSSVGTYSALSAASYNVKSSSTMTTTYTDSTMPPKRVKLSDNKEVYSSETLYNSSTATQTSATATNLSSPSTTNISGIDHAIQHALQRITRFTQSSENTISNCVNCKSEEFSHIIQTCHHLVCRRCLMELMKEHTCTCKRSFSGSDIERYHKL